MRQLYAIGLSGALIVVAGCSGQAPSKLETPKPSPTPIYDFRSEGSFPEVPEVPAIPASTAQAAAFHDDTDATDLVEDTSAEATTPMLDTQKPFQGWSVQVFAGLSREIAVRMQHQLQSVVPEMVYLDYIEPYYKVRVGDCEQRDECDTLQRRLRAIGTESAWVVPRRIQGTLQP